MQEAEGVLGKGTSTASTWWAWGLNRIRKADDEKTGARKVIR